MALLYTPIITYDPRVDPTGRKANHYKIERSPGDTFIYECFSDPETGSPTSLYHVDSLVMGIAGAYKSDKYAYPGPRSGVAVFVGPGNELNINGRPLPPVKGQFMSLARSELEACAEALRIALRILKQQLLPGKQQLQRLILKSDSETLMRGLTEWVYTWIRKGWVASENSRVRDWDVWNEILGLLNQLHVGGVQVSIWWVPRHWNREANREAAITLRVPPPRPN